MSKNWFRKDFDYLVGRRLQRCPQPSSNQRQKRSSADRPQHLPHLKRHNRLAHLKCDGKNFQQKCFENRRHVKYTFTDQPFNSRLTLEPRLEIFGPNKILDDDDIQLGWNPGIFANKKSVRINERRKHGDKINKNKQLNYVDEFLTETYDEPMNESPFLHSPTVRATGQQIPRLTTTIERVEEKSANLNSNDLNFQGKYIHVNETELDLHSSNDYSIISSEDNLSQFNLTTPDHETISFEMDANTNNDNDDNPSRKLCKHSSGIFPAHYFQNDPYFHDPFNYNRHQIRYSSFDTFDFTTMMMIILLIYLKNEIY
ncbi:hypothetical protein HUG17_8061 [Dermatophagoides farinae]|uniref:Uncharacterized protein n=1 Tax=Dermatophagoides farinae TaxID=6954 RepID=A0A9D4NYK9_DERFA|nr:hypothetical protein HUG17_8061 [Dermatophagoides farinae]